MAEVHRPNMPRPEGPIDPRVYRRIFEQDSDGAAILDELERLFAASAVTKGGIDAVLQTYHRAGARTVVEFIVKRVNQANGLEEPDTPEE